MPTLIRKGQGGSLSSPVSLLGDLKGARGGGAEAGVTSPAFSPSTSRPSSAALQQQQQQQQQPQLQPHPRNKRNHSKRLLVQCAGALFFVAAAALELARRRGSTGLDPEAASSSLSLLLFRPSTDVQVAVEQQEQQKHPSPPVSTSSPKEPTSLWSYEEIDQVLGCNSRQIVEDSVRHLVQLMDRARSLSYTNRTAYGTLHDPLFGFLIPKTGSNTQEYYHLEALAAVRQLSYTGCQLPGLYGCLLVEPHLSTRTCRATAFGNHFNPTVLVGELLKASCTASARGWNINASRPTTTTTTTATAVGDVLAKYGVCTAVFRNPLERIVSAFYEWSYRKTTNDTAIEHWRKRGASQFPKPQPQGSFIGMYQFINDPASVQPASHLPVDNSALKAVLTSCVVGVTEHLTDYVTTLSRVVWVNPPSQQQSALKVRARERHGMTQTTATDKNSTSPKDADDIARWTRQFYSEMEAYVRHDMALWHLARHVASAQVLAASKPPHHLPIIPSHLVPKELRSTVNGNCPGCSRCSPPGYEQFRWTSYAAAETSKAKTFEETSAAAKTTRSGSRSGGLSASKDEVPVACIGPNISQQLPPDAEGLGQDAQWCCAHDHLA